MAKKFAQGKVTCIFQECIFNIKCVWPILILISQCIFLLWNFQVDVLKFDCCKLVEGSFGLQLVL